MSESDSAWHRTQSGRLPWIRWITISTTGPTTAASRRESTEGRRLLSWRQWWCSGSDAAGPSITRRRPLGRHLALRLRGSHYHSGCSTAAHRRISSTAAFEYLAEQGCVSIFLRMHPGLNARLAESPDTLTRYHVLHHHRFPTPEQTEEESMAAMNSGHRYRLRLALKNGYSARHDANGDYWADFARMYRQNMELLGAAEYYLFDDSYFDSFSSPTGPPAELWVALKDDELAAAAIFTVSGDWVQYHLAASDPAHRRSSPGRLLIHSARMAFRTRGPRWLHLGGGVGGGADSLLEFKAGDSVVRDHIPNRGPGA